MSGDGRSQQLDRQGLVLFLCHRQTVLGILHRLRQRRAGAHIIQILVELRREEGRAREVRWSSGAHRWSLTLRQEVPQLRLFDWSHFSWRFSRSFRARLQTGLQEGVLQTLQLTVQTLLSGCGWRSAAEAPQCRSSVEPQCVEVRGQTVQTLLLLVDDVQIIGQRCEQSLSLRDDHVPLFLLLLQVFFPLHVQHIIHVLHSELHVLVQAADLLELLVPTWVQGFLVEQLQVIFILVEFALRSRLLSPGETLQQAGLQCTDVSMKRLSGVFNLQCERVQVLRLFPQVPHVVSAAHPEVCVPAAALQILQLLLEESDLFQDSSHDRVRVLLLLQLLLQRLHRHRLCRWSAGRRSGWRNTDPRQHCMSGGFERCCCGGAGLCCGFGCGGQRERLHRSLHC